ncbi:MAG: haloacid dehalogenase-like hydrolase [Lachnospiraceae bacterium]|nr:haloacid dehalogenase-like hydrolase [Lachnospiraceae bacterium]
MKNTKPVIAMMYDFDKTLCTKNMQEYSFIPDMRLSPSEFWSKSNELAKKQKMDGILAYMWQMIIECKRNSKSIHRSDFVAQGKKMEFYKGVEDWFKRINEFGESQGVKIEHYIISSGLREIIEGCSIFKEFTDVFACEYLYDENDTACWPKNVVNYTTKTQFLFRINKGVMDLSDDKTLNDYTPEDERRVPFRNMIYIADGLTDVPCMKLVKVNGGYSIAVYQNRKKQEAEELLKDQRVTFIAPADYSEGSALDATVKDIITDMAIKDKLVRQHIKQMEKVGK